MNRQAILVELPSAYRRARDRVSSLPVGNVDLDVVDFASQWTLFLGEKARLYDAYARLAERQETLGETIPFTILEILGRASMGDTNALSPWDAFRQSWEVLSRADDALTRQGDKGSERQDELRTREVQVRASLAKRYEQEFEPLDQFFDQVITGQR